MLCQPTTCFVPTPSDLTLLPAAEPLPLSGPEPAPGPAQQIPLDQRQKLAVQVLAGAHPVATLARQHQVSRKFLYQQAHTARQALRAAFQPQPADHEVLFHLPVTRTWLRQLILALVLVGHSP